MELVTPTEDAEPSAPPPAINASETDERMDIHKPKPIHNLNSGDTIPNSLYPGRERVILRTGVTVTVDVIARAKLRVGHR